MPKDPMHPDPPDGWQTFAAAIGGTLIGFIGGIARHCSSYLTAAETARFKWPKLIASGVVGAFLGQAFYEAAKIFWPPGAGLSAAVGGWAGTEVFHILIDAFRAYADSKTKRGKEE